MQDDRRSGKGKSMMQASQRVLPFDRVVLVLQGGGALGAYQAGAVQALDEAEMRLDWVCGISIGAINASLIAGNPPKQRVERLREFWESVTQPQLSVPGFPWLPPPLWSDDVTARMWANRMSAFGTMALRIFSSRGRSRLSDRPRTSPKTSATMMSRA